MLDRLVAWLSEANPQTKSENMVIRYGAELLLDNCLKLMILLIAGFAVGKGYDTILFLTVFCGLRMQAGGFHAKTESGCSLCMVLVWMVGMLGCEIVELSLFCLLIVSVIEVLIMLWKVPKTINRDCYTFLELRSRKITAIAIVVLSTMIAICFKKGRTLIVCAVILETITLLPE